MCFSAPTRLPTRLLFTRAALSVLPFVLSACETTDDETQPVQSEELAPPQAPVEAIPFLQDPQHQIWIPGYWSLGSAGFSWVSGKVVPRPSPTAVWAAARWVHHAYGWSFMQGHWE